MESSIIFRDRQELQSADFNNAQAFADDAQTHLVLDAIDGGLKFTGGTVSAASATTASVEALRFYNAGKTYAADAQTLNLFQYLPLVTKKIVAVVVWGSEVDTDVQPRDFLIDLTAGTTQPQAVAMQRARVCNVNLLPGTEAADPQAPTIQNGTLAIAFVYLTTTGIERIAMQDAARLPNLYGHEQRLGQMEMWKGQAEPRIASIATDLASLANKTAELAGRQMVVDLAGDVARLKVARNLPSSYANWDADYFGNAAKTDDTGSGYGAQIQNGLLFPLAAQATANIALFNPYDAGISRSSADLVLPKYTETARIKTEGQTGDVSVSAYQVQNHTLKAYETTVWDYHYGVNYNYYNGWYNSWFWSYYGYWYGWQGWEGYWTSHQETHYALAETTTSYNGAIIAQTVLVANAMWLTGVGLQFTQVGGSGDVMLVICETDAGKPNLLKTLANVTVARADLKASPIETTVPLPPVLVDAGKRVAIAIITQGDHRVATVSGNSYTQGTLFFGTDGDYFTGDLTRDLMFTLYGAQFANPRTEVQLQPLSLSGGMSDLAISTPQVVPKGTELSYEIQVGGRWYPLTDQVAHLTGLPDIVPVRVVLLGTSDLAPAFVLSANGLVGSRPGDNLVHWSTLRSLASPSTNIQVQIVVAQWNASNHSLACALVDGATTYTPATTVTKDEPDGQAKRMTFTFTPSPGISSYKIKLTGSKMSGTAPFVIIERIDVAS